MKREEWINFLKGLYHQHIIPKLHRIHRDIYHFEDLEYDTRPLLKASRSLRFIENNFSEDYNLLESFQPQFLEKILDDLKRGLRRSNTTLVESEIINVIDEFFDEIVDGMDISDIPEADFYALSEAGSQDPKSEIQLSIVRIKKRRDKLHYNIKYDHMEYCLKESELMVIKRKDELKESNSNKPPTKRIFKGLGYFCRGALLTAVDIGIMAGGWPWQIQISPDIKYGSIISIATGVGDIAIGVGEFRGE